MRFINIILLVLFLVNCSDKNLSFSGKRINNIPLNDLSIFDLNSKIIENGIYVI